MIMRQFERTAVAGRQQPVFIVPATAPYRPHRVNDVAGGQTKTRSDLRVARHAAVERATRLKQSRPGGAMNCAVNTAAAQQRGVGGVDDRVEAQTRDIGDDYLKPRMADPALRGRGHSAA